MVTMNVADEAKETITNKVCKAGFGIMVVSVFILGALAIFSKP